jgi:hypothetical protein
MQFSLCSLLYSKNTYLKNENNRKKLLRKSFILKGYEKIH